MHKKNINVFIATLVLGVTLAVSASVWATTVGTNLSVSGTSTLTGNVTASGTLSVTGASTLTGAATLSSTLAVTGATTLTGALTANGAVTLGDATSDAVNIEGTVNIGSSGTDFTNIIHGFCDFGPIVASQTIAASSTGSVACTSQAPSGHAAGDKVWLTASTTAPVGANAYNTIVFTGIASSTAAGRIQAMIYNGTGASFTVTTSSWQYFIIK